MGSDFAILEKLTDGVAWPETAQRVLQGETPPWGGEDFGTHWIVAGHRIREQVADDRLLVAFLRKVLPPYTGGPLVLFRGESKERFTAGTVGLSWSREETVAAMFAGGLNCVGGGLVLRASFPEAAIIAAPNAHSRYLGEHQYTVDPMAARAIEVVAKFKSNAA